MPKPIIYYSKNLVNELTIKLQNLKDMFSMQKCFKTNQKLVRGTSNLLVVRI